MVDATNSKAPPLSQLYVYVTNGCNCSCQHCWIVPVQKSGGGPATFISVSVLDAALAEAKPLGVTSVKWTGGEPTIHPDFHRLLEVQKKHGLSGSLETNGMAMTPALAAQLRDCDVRQVSVSVDGACAETHDTIRGVAGAYERTVRGIGCLTHVGIQPQIIMTLMQNNVEELEDLLDWAAEIGAGSVKLNILQPALRGKSLHEEGKALRTEELLEINRRLENGLAARYRFPVHLDIPMAFRSISRLMSPLGLERCGIFHILGLLADGRYALCGIGEAIPEMVFGEAGKGALTEIWHGHPTLRELREGLPGRLEGVCNRCLLAPACLGSCVAQNVYDRGKLWGGFWFCSQAEQQGVFPASRIGTG